MLRAFEGTEPRVAPSAYVDDRAVVVGDVVVEAGASVWPNATLRGDSGRIVVGEGANVQDNAVLHEDAELGPAATMGHGAILHAATAAEGCLIGMNAVVLDDARIGERAVVAAGSVVTEGTGIPRETLATGTPATVKTELDDASADAGSAAATHYQKLARRYEETAERIE